MSDVKSLMSGKDIVFVFEQDSVATAVSLLADQKIGAVIVLNKEYQLVGIFSERDLLTRVVNPGLNPQEVTMSQVMTTHLVVTDAHESHLDALQKLRQINARHLPVVEDGKLIGILSIRDLLHAEIEEKSEEIKWLNAYIHYIPPGKE